MIKGKFKKLVFQNNDNSYIVALFKVIESDEKVLKDEINKTITVTGSLPNVKLEALYTLEGEYQNHPKYHMQYAFTNYTLEKPSTIEAIEEFLASPFVEGCGKAYAEKIVEVYKEKALDKIKEDYNNLMVIKGMTPLKALKIYNSVLNYEKNDSIIMKLRDFGFSFDDASKILNKYLTEIDQIINGNFYLLKDIFEFSKLDELFVQNFDPKSPLRCEECLLDSMIKLSFNDGSTYYSSDEIYKALNALYKINLSADEFESYLDNLINSGKIVKEDNNYFLSKYYEEEIFIAKKLFKIANSKMKKIPKIKEKIMELENSSGILYNDEQKKAIISGLNNNVAIISGGPGTGKTTIVKAICQIYIEHYNLSKDEIEANIALLAPTGKASKRLAKSTGLAAYTIHRFLKWHKETNTFELNENNKMFQKFIIVDESSMIDVSLMKSLLSAMYDHVKLILVGDTYQLPSVGPGLVLEDLINSDYFAYVPLNVIYRQSDNSYIPFLAKDIKNQNIDDEFMYKRDDYNFLVCDERNIISKISETIKYGLEKGINEDNLQVLAPMYKGENGIDNLNLHLQKIYNPPDEKKSELLYGDKVYRENDKVMELINDSENNVFNGDIGKIIAIYKGNDNKMLVDIDFDGIKVSYEKKDLKNITHAYAISIHKSQGSEFEHIIMPICHKYYVMLYNKLLYTGVSRAKKSLTIFGDPRSFISGIQNNYASERKTSLKKRLDIYFQE